MQYRDRSWSLGGLSGERRKVSGGRKGKGQSVLHVAPDDLVEFMVAQYFITIKRLITALWDLCSHMIKYSQELRTSIPSFFQFVLLFLVTQAVWSVIYRHDTCYLQLVDILLILHKKGRDDLVIKEQGLKS